MDDKLKSRKLWMTVGFIILAMVLRLLPIDETSKAIIDNSFWALVAYLGVQGVVDVVAIVRGKE